METLDRDTAKKLFDHYNRNRDGIRNKPEMASVCLICGSVHIIPKPGNEHKLICRDCGFAFYRYACRACDKTIDGRDPKNPGCGECGLRVCTWGPAAALRDGRERAVQLYTKAARPLDRFHQKNHPRRTER